jgi:GTP cyclohydrolase I
MEPVGFDREKVIRGVRQILEGIGEDPERGGLQDTPGRVADTTLRRWSP